MSSAGCLLRVIVISPLLLLAASGCQTDNTENSEIGESAADEGSVSESAIDHSIADATSDTGSPMESGQPFCLELLSANDAVLLGEPLTLMVNLRNCSDDVREVRDLLRPEYGLLSLQIGHSQFEQEKPYYPAVLRDGRGKGYVELAPGGSISATVPVYFGRDGWQLIVPGNYSFQADYFVDDIELTSNVVVVNVAYPQSSPEIAAAEMLMSDGAASFYFLGGGDESTAAELRALAAAVPDSPWAAQANLALAIDSANDGNSLSRVDACRSLETALIEMEQDWIVALRGLEALTRCLRESGLESDVARVSAEFVSRHPDAEATLLAGSD